MSQWLAALVLPEDVVQIPAPMPGGSQLPLTPASGDLMVSFGLADFKGEQEVGLRRNPLASTIASQDYSVPAFSHRHSTSLPKYRGANWH